MAKKTTYFTKKERTTMEMRRATKWISKASAKRTLSKWKSMYAHYPALKKPFFQVKQKGTQWAVFSKEKRKK